jgi:hypothetical protein
MRALFAFAVLTFSFVARADPPRAQVLASELHLDATAAKKLGVALAAHDRELDRLTRERGDLKHQLVAPKHPMDLDTLFDRLFSNQRAMATTDHKLVTDLRQFLSADDTARVIADVTDVVTPPPPPPPPEPQPDAELFDRDHEPMVEKCPQETATPVAASAACDPFASMHGCAHAR